MSIYMGQQPGDNVGQPGTPPDESVTSETPGPGTATIGRWWNSLTLRARALAAGTPVHPEAGVGQSSYEEVPGPVTPGLEPTINAPGRLHPSSSVSVGHPGHKKPGHIAGPRRIVR